MNTRPFPLLSQLVFGLGLLLGLSLVNAAQADPGSAAAALKVLTSPSTEEAPAPAPMRLPQGASA